MKTLLIICILFCNFAYSAEYKLSASFFNVHNFKDNIGSQYRNKITADGRVIANPFILLQRDKIGFILGTDSMGYGIAGFVAEYEIKPNLSLLYGGYNYNQKQWNNQNVWNDAGETLGFIPLISIKKDFKINKKVDLFLQVSPFVSGLGMSYKF